MGIYKGATFPLVPLVAKHTNDRLEYYRTKGDNESKREDFLDKLLKAKETHPKAISDREVLSLSLTMILAGAETTSDPFPPVHLPLRSLTPAPLPTTSLKN